MFFLLTSILFGLSLFLLDMPILFSVVPTIVSLLACSDVTKAQFMQKITMHVMCGITFKRRQKLLNYLVAVIAWFHICFVLVLFCTIIILGNFVLTIAINGKSFEMCLHLFSEELDHVFLLRMEKHFIYHHRQSFPGFPFLHAISLPQCA